MKCGTVNVEHATKRAALTEQQETRYVYVVHQVVDVHHIFIGTRMINVFPAKIVANYLITFTSNTVPIVQNIVIRTVTLFNQLAVYKAGGAVVSARKDTYIKVKIVSRNLIVYHHVIRRIIDVEEQNKLYLVKK